MVKKLFAAMILAFTLIVAGQTSTAEAGEVYVGSYSDGSSVYLLTHTVSIQSRNPYCFTCTVRAGGDYLNYNFSVRAGHGERTDGIPCYTNSEGYSGDVFNVASPVAAAIYKYVSNNY